MPQPFCHQLANKLSVFNVPGDKAPRKKKNNTCLIWAGEEQGEPRDKSPSHCPGDRGEERRGGPRLSSWTNPIKSMF